MEEDSKRLSESNPALTESVKVMLREESPLARRFFVEDEKYWAEYWVSPEGQKMSIDLEKGEVYSVASQIITGIH